MSGHSKWHSIRHKKSLTDQKRGKLFTKLIREIMVAARIGGSETSQNSRLKLAVQRAKESNMPSENIEKAIKKGIGDLSKGQYEDLIYEGYGPGGVAILLEVLTENKNRTVSELRRIFSRNGGSLADLGSVSWIFEKRGFLLLEESSYEEEELIQMALELGVSDFQIEEGQVFFYTERENFESVKSSLKEHNIGVESSGIERFPKNTLELGLGKKDQLLRLIEMLEDQDDVQTVSSNLA